MGQPWSMRECLIGAGTGTSDRWKAIQAAVDAGCTEARLHALGLAMMDESRTRSTVNFVPNCRWFPAGAVGVAIRIPNFLVNGGTGIAVGMATNPASQRSAKSSIHLCAVGQPGDGLAQLMHFVKGPDFRWPCEIAASAASRNISLPGAVRCRLRGRCGDRGKWKCPLDHSQSARCPTAWIVATLQEAVAELVNDRSSPAYLAHARSSDEETRSKSS